MRGIMSWTLLVLGGALLALGVTAGYVNRTVLDTPTFAERVDELRTRDDVSQVLGREVSTRLVARNPDLVAIAPLVEQISIAAVRSDVLSGPVKVASAQFHEALTSDDSDVLVLRIADVGAVVAGIVGAVAPERAPSASDAAATLAEIGSAGFAPGVVQLVDLVDTLAWLLPLLAVACLVGAILLRSDRWDGIRRSGWAVVIAASAVATLIAIGGWLVRAAGSSERSDILLDAVWEVFVRPIWVLLALVGVVGALLVMVGAGRAAGWDPAGAIRRVSRPPTSSGGAVARSVAMIAVGAAIVVDPGGMLTVAAIVGGVVLVVSGISALAGLAADGRGDDIARERGRWVPLAVVGAVGVLAVAGLAAWLATPPDGDVAGAVDGAVAGEGLVCNGHAELCDRRFDEVSLAASHNSMSVAGKPGWYLGEQGLDIVPQLDFGVRALLVDVWYGFDAGNGRVRTSARSYEEALAVANEELGPDIVAAALRTVDAVTPSEPQGDEALYMCHGLCETGATSFDTTLGDVRAWLATHPDEVMAIFVEDHVDADDVAAAVTEAGLGPYLHTPVGGAPFPTLGDMIRAGDRLIVMLEEGDGRPEHPWLVNGFEFVQETPYTFPTVESFSCVPNRGEPDAPLFQLNHWIAGFTELVSSAQLVNTADVLGARAEQCRDERGLQPTFVAVNYADIGDVIAVVDQLNDVG
jgi:hypothetical protein